MSMGQHGIWGKGNGTFPMNMYESAVKVPFIISWPCFIKPGSVCCELVSAYDLFPTLLELTGLSGRFPEGLPGKTLDCFSGEGRDADRGNRHFDEYGPVRMIRDREWKYIHRYPYGAHELYHLTDDPGRRNLYGMPGTKRRFWSLKADGSLVPQVCGSCC